MNNMISFLVNRGLVVNLVTIFLIGLGLYSIFAINREAFPNVNIDRIQVDVNYPGASPKEIEQLIVTPIEQELRALNGIDTMISFSFPGSARIAMEVDPDASNREKISNEVALAVDRAKLPSDLPNDPFVTEVDGSVFPIIRLAVSAPLDALALKRVGDKIKDDLLTIPGVAKVVIQGDRKAEFRIIANPKKMAQQRVSVSDIANSVQAWNLNIPGGDLDTRDGQKSVRVVGEFTSPQDAANLVLRANDQGQAVRLGDVAEVKESLVKPLKLFDVSGEPALSMLVLKKADGDIINTVNAIREYIKVIPGRYGANVKASPFQDFSQFARMRLGVLTNNGIVGVFLVFITLILFLRLSVALTTTIGLPIIFLFGLFCLYASGITLNLISMMAFIMVLGMLVDDAIIIGENITYHMEDGMGPVEASIKGAMELIGPVTTTILTTVAAFIPMMFVSGIIGKFIIAIPIVVITLLVLSWLESFLILPSHVAHFTNPHKHPPERAWIVALENFYGRILTWSVRHCFITVLLSFGISFLLLVVLLSRMDFQLFPSTGVAEYIARVTAPPGTSINRMREYLREIDKDFRDHIDPKYLEATLLKSGDVSNDEGDPLTQRGGRYGQIRVIYTPAVSRPEHDALKDMNHLSKLVQKKYTNLEISLAEVRPGPPLGRALQAEISSFDVKASEIAAQRLMDYLETIEGVKAIDSGLKRGDDELIIQLDRRLATFTGVDLATASAQIRAVAGGLTVSTIRRGTEEMDVTIRFPENPEGEVELLKNLLIPNKRGGLIPLSKIATFKQQPGFTTINHKEGIRVVNVVADVDSEKLSSIKLNNLVRKNEAQWQGDVADKVTINYGGEEEKNQESFNDLKAAFLFAMIAIFFILAIQFNSLGYPLLVMLAIPFGAVGIVVSFFLHDMFWKPLPLSFFSMLGMVALTGVVVNSSLILLVFVQRAIKDGMGFTEAVILAGRRRLRAVILTATTTIVGLLPTAYGWGGLDPFVSPMALSLSWGLVFATVVTLITIPATTVLCHIIYEAIRPLIPRFRKAAVSISEEV